MNRIRRKHILAVDDELFSRRVIAQSLEREFCVTSVSEPGDALSILSAMGGLVDLVVCDLHLGPQASEKQSGLDILQAVRAGTTGCRRDLPFILLTADGRREAGRLAAALHVDSYLVKPVRHDDLRDAVIKLIGVQKIRVAGAGRYAQVATSVSPVDPSAPAG